MKECLECENQYICHQQIHLDMQRIKDIRFDVENLHLKEALDSLDKFRDMLVKRNLRITGRD